MIHTSSLENSLKDFNISTFRQGQEEIITDVLNGNDVLGILPTGSGKSLCYQLPAKLLEGTTIVVSPLISLMHDQVKQLKAKHFKEVIALNSSINYIERKNTYRYLHSYKLIYISPELLQNEELLSYLTQIKISLFVIDEAHCISQWGHEFRPDYLKLESIINRLGNPPILALSATVTETVQVDIVKTLKRPHMIKHVYPIDRTNIAFTIQEVSNNTEKMEFILKLLHHKRVPTIIYFSSRAVTEKVANLLSTELPHFEFAFYHGGMDQNDRVIVQQQFMNDQLDVICCTSAFGMGIDKPNIRLVIHYHMPNQIESYIQEVGRAGRDGKESLSVLLYSHNDKYIPLNIIDNELPSEDEVNMTFKKIYDIYSKNKVLPPKEEEILGILQLGEIKWRFLQYQMERYGIIKDKIVQYNVSNWDEARQKIKKLIKNRQLLKQRKLNEMLGWIHEEHCLRKRLYKPFQHSYQPALYQCCSNCGYSLNDWMPEQTMAMQKKHLSWHQKLKNILLIEGDYEAE